MERNYSGIWAKYPQFNEENTIMVSNYHNLIDDYQSNDIVLPYYDPKTGQTDFLDDKHLSWIYNYMNFIESGDFNQVSDVR